MSKLSNNGKGSGCMIVFGLIFFVAGLLPGWFGVSTISQSIQARSWTPVAATIHSANLNSSTDSEGSTTYSVSGRFSYTMDGRDYFSEQVSFDGGSDNIGSFHQDAYETLQKSRTSGEPLTAWVDPDDHERAVIFRDIRWGMVLFLFMFTLVFSGVGAGIMLFSIIGGRKLKQRVRQVQARKAAMGLSASAARLDASEDPMLARPQALADLAQPSSALSDIPVEPWEIAFPSNELTCGSTGTMWFLIIFAVLWNLISMPVWFFVPDEVAAGNTVALLAFLFPLVGFGLAAGAVYSIIKHRKYGRGTLTLSTFPPHPGGLIKGTLSVPRAVEASDFDVVLSCLSRRTSGSGKNRSTRESSIWQDQVRIPILQYGDQGCGANLRITLPADALASTSFSGEDGILWRLRFMAECPGVDFSQTYTLPVVEGVAPAMDSADLMDALTAPFDGEESDADTLEGGDWKATGVQFDPASKHYQFPGNRSLAGTLITAVIFLVFTGVGVGMGLAGEWLFSVVFGGVGLLIGSACYFMLCKTRLKVDLLGLRRARGILWTGRGRLFKRDDIASIQVIDGSSVNDRRFYRLVLVGHDKRRHTLVGMLPNKRDAHALAERFSDTLGLSTDPSQS